MNNLQEKINEIKNNPAELQRILLISGLLFFVGASAFCIGYYTGQHDGKAIAEAENMNANMKPVASQIPIYQDPYNSVNLTAAFQKP